MVNAPTYTNEAGQIEGTVGVVLIDKDTGAPYNAGAGGGGGGGDASAANQVITNTKLDTLHTDLGTTLAGYLDGLEGFVDGLEALTTTMSAKLPAALGGTTSANSLPVVLSSDGPFALQTGAVTETAPTTDIASSGLNGRLQRLAQLSPRIAVVSLTPVLDTAIYADGDILFDTIVMASSFLSATGVNRLDSFHVLDEDDQGVAFDVILLNALTSLGTINVASSISDINARNILGFFSVASSDYIDIGGSRLATIRNIGLDLATGSTNLWVAGITRGGTPTYTASGMKFKFGFTQTQI